MPNDNYQFIREIEEELKKERRKTLVDKLIRKVTSQLSLKGAKRRDHE